MTTLAWRRCQVGCGGPDPLLCSPPAAVCTFRARRVNRSPWGTWVSLFFGRSLSQQRDITDCAAQATMDVCEKHRIRCTDDLRRQPCFSTQPMKYHTLPCHGFLALAATGIVALFAVHLAASAPSAGPNVCSVHLPMSTEISAVGGRFLPGGKATICLLWDKHLQTDIKRRPEAQQLNYSAFI